MAAPVAYGPAGQRAVPIAEAAEQAGTDSETSFTQQVPVLHSWRLTRDNLSRILQPTLIVLAIASPAMLADPHDLLPRWLTNVEPPICPACTT